MKLLSQQIRELVQRSQTSVYAIAREAGIEKSAMSRFMNGGRLTMEKLDQLARILGITVSSDFSLVPRPLEKGRPKPKKEVRMNKKQAQFYADYFANDAFENHFQSRRGIWYLEDADCLLLYDNNPYAGDATRRPRLMKTIKERLKRVGIKVLACGSSRAPLTTEAFKEQLKEAGLEFLVRASGQAGEQDEDPYTISLLLDCSRDRMDEVFKIVQEVVNSFL